MARHRAIPIGRPIPGAAIAAAQVGSGASDFRMASDCRRRAEECLRLWEIGRALEIDHVRQRAEAGDRRFRGRTDHELTMIGAMRWSQSTEAQRLRRREDTYTRRAMRDLGFARFVMHIHELAGQPSPVIGAGER